MINPNEHWAWKVGRVEFGLEKELITEIKEVKMFVTYLKMNVSNSCQEIENSVVKFTATEVIIDEKPFQ